ncbi:MAG: hypothetical protein NTW25_12745 [Candidatus Kapabacteria bacterium]|nr:hypothetical protein [Candidatus Kapabacteria bacterium]
MKKYLYILTLISILNSCIIVKEKEQKEEVKTSISLSPKPEIDMSDQMVRSTLGDMIAFLPKDWFFVDGEDKAPAEVYAIAVNPDYSLCAVFSEIRKNDEIDEIVKKESLMGLARLSYEKHNKKSAGSVQLVGKFQNMVLGQKNFVKYEISNSNGAITSKVIVFQSDMNHYYQFTLIPMDVQGKPIPPKDEINKIFNSILATIRY